MSYSWDKIGKRIKEERKKMPSALPKTGKRKAAYVTQAELGEMICKEMGMKDTGTYRKRVGEWESGEPADLKDLLALCNIFHCDIHYLLCETDTRYYTDMKDTVKYGLSEEALSTLREMCYDGYGFELVTISAMIQNRHLIESITELWISAHDDLFYQNSPFFHETFPEGIAWYQPSERKQKEFELYRTLVDFIEDDSNRGIGQTLIKKHYDEERLTKWYKMVMEEERPEEFAVEVERCLGRKKSEKEVGKAQRH